MFGGHFYHSKTKKAVALFGRLFNNLYVIRKNSSGAVISQLKVPLSYAPKQKYLERIRENPSLREDSQVAIKLPRMSFEITSIAYDAQRQLTKVGNFTTTASTGVNTKRQKFEKMMRLAQLTIACARTVRRMTRTTQMAKTMNTR